ncbi:MAG: MMPL family transporter [Thermoguttaceae bacterium]|nr:MMPL family transporter [Thermoguttaceae bacterium]
MKNDFFKEYGFRIVFVVVFLLSFVWMGTKQTLKSNSNSVEDWLPAQYQQTRDYQWYLNLFPFESYVVVSWDGCEIGDDRLELFAQKLVPGQTIDNFSLSAPTADFKADLEVSETPDEAKEALRELVGGEKNVSTEALVDAAGADLPEKETAKPAEENYFKSVMTGPRLARLLRDTYLKMPQYSRLANDAEATAELDARICERLKGTLIGPDGKSSAMIITLNQGRRDGKSLKVVLEKIRALAVESGLPDTSEIKSGSIARQAVKNFTGMIDEMVNGRKVRMDGVILGGPPVDNVALDLEGTRTLFRLAGICAIVGVSIAFACLRSMRLTMFVFWISALSAGVALALVSLTGGTCDSILLSMPALVYVLGMSGAVHLINYYHDAIREGGLDGATERAVRHAFTPCFFAQLTTALGLGSLFAGRLVPITKFGFYSAVGVLMTLLLLFLYLPALLYFYPSKKFAAQHAGKGVQVGDSVFRKFWDALGGFIIRRHWFVVGACATLMIFFGCYLPHIKTSVKMMSFFSDDAEIIKHYGWLEEKLGPLVPMEITICFDNDKLSRYSFGTAERLALIDSISEKMKTELKDDVGGTLSVALFAPEIDASRGGLTGLATSTVVGKAIDDSRDELRDYLAIEGNPTLDELAAFLEERATAEKTAFDERAAEFDAELKEKADGTFDEAFAALDAASASDGEIEERFAPFVARLQHFRADRRALDKLLREADALKNNRDYLSEQNVADLQTLLATTASERSLRKIATEEVAALRDGAKRWQTERGVEIWRISARVWSLKKDIDYSAFIENVKNVVEPTLAERSLALTEGENAAAKIEEARAYVAANLPEGEPKPKKNDDEIACDAKFLTREFVLQDLTDEERAELQASMGSDHEADWIYPAGFAAKYTGMVPLVYKTQHELINGLTSSLVMAFFLIAFVFVVILRSAPAALIAMIPNVFPVVVVFGFMAWAGILVDVGTMMTASVALGVAVDDTMHYLTWFSDGVQSGMRPKEAALNAYRRCAPAMTQSTLIAGLGLFSFAFSTFVPTQRFGVLMLAILATALMGDLIFLPALLTCGPFGRFFLKRRISKRRDLDAPKESSDASSEVAAN